MGEILKSLPAKRSELVVSVKMFGGTGLNTINDQGLSRKKVIESMHNSLKRLQLDYADIVFAHRHDHEAPIEEVCRAFDQLIRNGQAHYWGTSEWSSFSIMEAFAVCDRLNLHRPVVEQPQYNIFVRDRFEKEYGRLFDEYKLGSTVWSPLCGGIATKR